MKSISAITPFILLFFFGSMIMINSCGGDTTTPKPRAYPRTDLPEKHYQQYDSNCPFSFQYPVYAQIEYDTAEGAQPCWININYTSLNAQLYLSYKDVESRRNMQKLAEDARDLVYKHTVMAEEIREELILAGSNVHGMYYDIRGNTATAIQFFLTDSTHHFIRGSLYFNSPPNRDSLQPMIDFIEEDIIVMIRTFDWKYTDREER